MALTWKKKKGSWKAYGICEYKVTRVENNFTIDVKIPSGQWMSYTPEEPIDSLEIAKAGCEGMEGVYRDYDKKLKERREQLLQHLQNEEEFRKRLKADLGDSTIKVYHMWNDADFKTRSAMENHLVLTLKDGTDLISLFNVIKDKGIRL